MSDVWVSQEAIESMLLNKKNFTEDAGVYKSDDHKSFLENAIKYLYGED